MRNFVGNNNNYGEIFIEFVLLFSNVFQLFNGFCVFNFRKLRKDLKRIMLGIRSDVQIIIILSIFGIMW